MDNCSKPRILVLSCILLREKWNCHFRIYAENNRKFHRDKQAWITFELSNIHQPYWSGFCSADSFWICSVRSINILSAFLFQDNIFGCVSVKYKAAKYFFAVLIYLMKIFLFDLLLSLEEAKRELLSCSLNN